MRTNKSIPLGSGITHILEFDGTMPSVESIISSLSDENKLGETKNGATFEYSGEIHEEKDDFGKVMRVLITEEKATLKPGVFTWALNTLEKLVATARVSEEGKYRILRIGGVENDTGKQYVIVFHVIDKKEGDLWLILLGSNTAGISIKFARDSSEPLAPEFTALPHDEAGTLAMLVEEKVNE